MATSNVRAAMVEVLSGGPLTSDELIERVAADPTLGRPAALVHTAVQRVLQRSTSFAEVGDRWCYLPALADGTRWTVAVDADLAAQNMLRMHPSLSPIGWWLVDEGVDLVDAAGYVVGRVDTDGVWLDGADTDVLIGSDGWLDAVAGGLATVTVRSETLQVSPLAAPPEPTQRQADAIRAGFDAVATDVEATLFDGEQHHLRYSNADSPVLAALIADRDAFTATPVPPLPDLFAAAGLEQRHHTVAAAGFDWEALDAWHRRNRMRTFYGLDDPQIDAVLLVAGACGTFAEDGLDALGPEDQHEGAAMLIAAMLEEHGVAEAFWHEVHDRGGTVDDIVAFTDVIADLMEGVPVGGLGWVQARCLRERGEHPEAIDLVDRLVERGADHPGVLVEAAAAASDRGDAMRALELVHRAGIHENELDDDGFDTGRDIMGLAVRVLDEVVPYARHRPRPIAGRNEPCPCGSGRKYKSCHLGKERHSLDDRSAWLHRKLIRFLSAEAGGLLDDLVTDLLGPSGRGRRDPDTLPLVTDLALHDHGVLDDFLEARGWLLPEDEQLLATQWTLVDRGVFEILDQRNDSLRLRNVGTGDAITVVNTYGSDQTRAGMMLLGRPLPVGDAYRAFTGFLRVPPTLTEEYVQAVADDDTDRLVELVAQLFAPPRFRNTSGEDIWFHTISWDVGECGSVEAIDAALVQSGLRHTDDRSWSLTEDTRGMTSAVIGTVGLDATGVRLTADVNSDERAERMLVVIAAALPDARLVDDRRRSVDEVREDAELADDDDDDGPGALDPDDPEVQAFVEQTIRQKEIEWLDLEIPALAGRTPREAVADPIGREQVIRLLASIPTPGTGYVGFDPARLSALLGLT